jgi:hypothetical protein
VGGTHESGIERVLIKRFYVNEFDERTGMSVLSVIHLAMASAEKPILCISMVSLCFGLPLEGKCMNTGAVFMFNWKN